MVGNGRPAALGAVGSSQVPSVWLARTAASLHPCWGARISTPGLTPGSSCKHGCRRLQDPRRVGLTIAAAAASVHTSASARRLLLSHRGRQLVAADADEEGQEVNTEIPLMAVAWQPNEVLHDLGVCLEEPELLEGCGATEASEHSTLCSAVALGCEGRIAVDVTTLEEERVLAAVRRHLPAGAPPTSFVETRPLMVQASPTALADCGRARALLNWHGNHQFCGKCGSPTMSVGIGAKRLCSNSTCGARLYPRTDPVAIALVVHSGSDRILLGRSGRLRRNMYTCLSGFVEPNEPVEEAVRREVHEEAGVEVGMVRLLQSQPWPTGRGGSCELMLGCIAEAVSTEIHVDSTEMEDVRWFSRAEAEAALEASRWASMGREPPDPAAIFVPGSYAIAHHLIRHWLEPGGS